LQFRESPSGVDLPDTITGVKHSDLAWLPDNSGIFYSVMITSNDLFCNILEYNCQKYPDQKSELTGSSTEKHKYHSLYFHKMGTDQQDDVLCVDFRDHPDYMM
jgi:prolyl oligopeptidase